MRLQVKDSRWAVVSGLLRGLWIIFKMQFRRPVTIQYPEERTTPAPRNRGRIVLTRDPDGEERNSDRLSRRVPWRRPGMCSQATISPVPRSSP